MVAENNARLVPLSYLLGASCPWSARPRAALGELTAAERLVVAQVARGLSNKEIAGVLKRAEPTIKHQLSAAMRKLGVRSRCELIVRLLN